MIAQILVSALTLGAIYALIAIGFTIVFATKRIINFAHGEFVMLGGVLSVYFAQALALPLAVAVLIAIACVGLVALLIYLLALDRRSDDMLSQVMITLGLAIAIKGAVQITIGKATLFLPPFSSASRWSFFGFFVNPQAALIMG